MEQAIDAIEVDAVPTNGNLVYTPNRVAPEHMELFREFNDENTNPFAPVHIDTLTSDEHKIKVNTRVISTTQVDREGNFVQVEAGQIGPHYGLIEHEDLYRKLQDIKDLSGLDWHPTWQLTTKGASVFVRIEVADTAPVVVHHNGSDHEYFPTVAIINSYDGTQKARFLFGAYNRICLNLSRNGWDFASYEVRHNKGSLEDWNKQLDELDELVGGVQDSLETYVKRLITMQSIDVDTKLMALLWNEIFSELPNRYNADVLDRFYHPDTESHTVYDLFQAATGVMSTMKRARLADMSRNDLVSNGLHKFISAHKN